MGRAKKDRELIEVVTLLLINIMKDKYRCIMDMMEEDDHIISEHEFEFIDLYGEMKAIYWKNECMRLLNMRDECKINN